MNVLKNTILHPHLRDEEAAVVENAIRLAIDSVINVLCGVNSAKTHEHRRMVADRDKEIQRLECRLKEIEHELQVLRRHGCTCGSQPNTCDPHRGEQSGYEPGGEMSAAQQQQECEMSISLGLFARPPSHISSQSLESALPSSPSRMGLDQSCTSHFSESSGVSETANNLSQSPSGIVVKEEPCEIDAVLIKWEMSEERFGEHQESSGSPCQDTESFGVKERFKEKPHADPDGPHFTEGENLRNKKKTVPMSELPEETQRLKRAAWRAASKRYYARKIARQQASSSRPGPFPHITDSRFTQPITLVDKRRRTTTRMISELTDESQTLQREAWRAASRSSQHREDRASLVLLLPPGLVSQRGDAGSLNLLENQGLLGRRRRLSRLGLGRGRYRHSQSQKRNHLARRGESRYVHIFTQRPQHLHRLEMMMDEEIIEDRAKLKQGLVKVLECVATISSAAAVVNPIFGVAGSLIRVVLHHVDDEDIRTLKREFGSVNRALDQLSQMNRNTLVQIKKETLDGQYCRVEENLKNQFRKFMDMVEARPEHRERKKEDFEESYANDLGDQNLHTLYDGVVGTPKLFSRPILEVYLKHSQGDRQTMERLCTRLTYLFCIGLIALMGYAAVIGDDEESLSEEWAEKMEHVQEKMQDALRRCK
ncbi:hypothetical protein D5F01_LYC13062 [Larimichthys crocea]|uniref:Protein rapunzel n=2 Tax=Larimichthys crocea TaxID=215358 RepID=A0A6G0ID70_LARCR|nr:hypothetical protein D5F01_LYC13062 [Larimichthys crocea]